MRSLRAKLVLGFGGLLAILMIVSLLSVIVLTRYSHTLERAFRDNYNSAIYCDRMREALDALDAQAQRRAWGAEAAVGQIDQAGQIERFEANLDLELGNCTVPGELELSRQLQALWRDYKLSYIQFDSTPGHGAELYRQR